MKDGSSSRFVKLVCSNPFCKKEFDHNEAMYNSKKKWGQKNFYCSPECGNTNRLKTFVIGGKIYDAR